MKKQLYKITTFKGLDKRLSKSLKEDKEDWNELMFALYETLYRYNKSNYKNYRGCNNSNDKFEVGLLKRSDDPNPIMNRIYEKLGVDFEKFGYISLYSYDKTYEETGKVFRVYLYENRSRSVFHIFNKTAIPKKLMLSYPSIIRSMIVKGEYNKLEKAIDYFCSNIKLDFSSKVGTEFINILDLKLQRCIDEYKKLKKEQVISRLNSQ